MTLLALLTALVHMLVASPGDFSWPIGSDADPPTVRAGFDPPAQPWLPGHRGVDLAATRGMPVVAAGDGVIAYAGPLAGRGVISIVHEGGLRTTYEPVLAEVSIGMLVRRGQVIATVDRWPVPHPSCPGNNCLHWGARLGSRYVDPLSLLTPARVRLLPEPTRSRPGMGLLVSPSQPLDRDVGVALRGGDRRVPQQLLNRAQVGAAFQ